MPVKTAQEMLDNWKAKMAVSSEAYRKGVSKTTTDPAEAAIAQQGRAQAAYTQAMSSGRWAGALRKAAAKGSWKSNALSKGADRIASGALAAAPKFLEHAQAIVPVNQALRQTVDALPKGGKEAAKQRFAAMLDAYEAFKMSKGQS